MANVNKDKQLFKYQVLITGISVFIVVVFVFSLSYSIFSKTKDGDEYNIIKVGNLELSYSELSDEGNTLQLVSEYPISDNDGMKGVSYRFAVENTGTIVANYRVKVIDDNSVIKEDGCENQLIDNSYLKYSINNGGSYKLNANSGNQYDDNGNLVGVYYQIYTGTLQPHESDVHEVRLWISEDSPNTVLGKHYHGKVIIEIEQGNGSNPYNEPSNDTLKGKILSDNFILGPVDVNSNNSQSFKSGLYVSNKTNSSENTYYFSGNVENNYVDFANNKWRIVRVNEDGTVRLILAEGINNNYHYLYNSQKNSFEDAYFSNSLLKAELESWYNLNMANYDSMISKENHFCEQGKVTVPGNILFGNNHVLVYSDYLPSFNCSSDSNNKGYVDMKIGLISYDELVYAGDIVSSDGKSYINNGKSFWSMTSGGYNSDLSIPIVGYVNSVGSILFGDVGLEQGCTLRPVINLNANLKFSGNGSVDNPYIIVE